MDADKMFTSFLTLNDKIDRLAKTVKQDRKKIKMLRIGLVGLTIYSLGLALELAERKRSENYLKDKIDELEEKIDGGAADA